ncbi:MAG: CaiB/BaiF CoA-transferase family protein, partial [Pseudomonadota bacterium]
MQPVLKDCLVLDLSRLLPGPFCSMILADYGARVIAIEHRDFKKDAIYQYQGINRNKEHITLNLKTRKGKDIFYKLVKTADVVMEGFRPGVASRLEVNYEVLKRINPGLIYCSITGYGQNGPLKDQAGHDINYLGYSGVLSLIGPKEGEPCIPGIQIADMMGGLNSAIGILMALYQKEKTGNGRYIDISMTDCLISLMPQAAGELWTTGSAPARGDSLLSHRYACYNIYRTKDNKFITLAALETRFWEALCLHLGLPEYIPLQYDEHQKNEIIRRFQAIFSEKTRDEWVTVFTGKDVCLGAVWDVKEALESRQTESRGMVIQREGPNQKPLQFLGSPIALSDYHPSIRSLPPAFGEHTHSVL